jgi:2-polyprenyl-3-methyl-5-hydroxy-6-metoxy-1,4-benzoquinol methylase
MAVGLPPGARLESVECPFCAAGTPQEELFSDPPFAVKRCSGCRLVFVSPRIAGDQVAAIYGESYWRSPSAKDFGFTDYRADAGNWLRTYRRRAHVLDGLLAPPARILDVGCAAGYFLDVMCDSGFEGWGIEVSAAIAREARTRIGEDRIHIGTLRDHPFEDSSFDLVTLWDVVEHLPDPVSALVQARRLLKPGGLLLLETQNVESVFARLMRRRWQHFKQAEHLWHFSPATVSMLLDRAGFTPVARTARRAGKFVSLEFVAERAVRVHPLLSRALSPLARLNASIYVNLFDEMIVVARPR